MIVHRACQYMLMYSLSVAAMITFVVAVKPASAKLIQASVTYAHAERVFIDIGSADGVVVGARVTVTNKQRGKRTGPLQQIQQKLQVVSVAEHTCAAVYLTAPKWYLRTDDSASVHVTFQKLVSHSPKRMIPGATQTPTGINRGERLPHSSSQFTKVPFAGVTKLRVLNKRSLINEATLSGLGFWGMPAGQIYRQQVIGRLYGPIDKGGNWVVDADFAAIAQQTVDYNARFRAGDPARFELYRGNIAYKGISALALTAGRMSGQRLRYGVLDGVSVAIGDERLMQVMLSAGLRPDPMMLSTDSTSPMVSAGLTGELRKQWGILSYQMDTSWISGRPASSTVSSIGASSETSARIAADVAGAFWLDGEMGVVTALGSASADKPFVVDRARISASTRVGGSGLLQLSARRLENVNLTVDLPAFPNDIENIPSYDFFTSYHRPLGTLGRTTLETSLSGGAVQDGSTASNTAGLHVTNDALAFDQYWFRGVVSGRHPWKRSHFRVVYHGAQGWSGLQSINVGGGLNISEQIRFNLSQQAALAFLPESKQMLPTFSTWGRISYRLSDKLSAGLRVRGDYGFITTGIEGQIWLGAEDLF